MDVNVLPSINKGSFLSFSFFTVDRQIDMGPHGDRK